MPRLFPNAEILMPEVEYKFWDRSGAGGEMPEGIRPHIKRIQSTFPTWKNVKQYADGRQVAPGCARDCDTGHIRRTHVVPGGVGRTATIHPERTSPASPSDRQKSGWHTIFDSDAGWRIGDAPANSSIASLPRRDDRRLSFRLPECRHAVEGLATATRSRREGLIAGWSEIARGAVFSYGAFSASEITAAPPALLSAKAAGTHA